MKKVVLIICMMLLMTSSVFAVNLKGKTVLIEGDSLQASYGKYLETAIRKMGPKKVVNRAKNGSTLGNRIKVGHAQASKGSVYYRMKKLKTKYDYVFIAAGTNDYGQYMNHGLVKIGSYKTLNKNTTCGALNVIINKIRKVSSKTKIVVVTPIYKYGGWNKNNYKKRKITDCDALKNEWGKTLSNYRSEISKTASRKGVYVINGSTLAFKKEINSSKNMIEDHIHPKTHFANTIANRAYNKIKSL